MTEWEPVGSGDPLADSIVSIAQLESLSRDRLDGDVWGYVAGGAGNEVTLHDNRQAWSRRRLLPRAMVDVSNLTTEISLLGSSLPHPLLLAPSATHGRYHPDGEFETLRGANASESIMTLSTLGSAPVNQFGEAARALGSSWWMQVYLQQDRSLSYSLLDRVVSAGAQALVLTVDTPSLGARDRDQRDAFGATPGVDYPNIDHLPVAPDSTPAHRRVWNSHLANDVTPSDISRLRERFAIPVIAKGILRADDARRAVDAGASALIVSNHGARNLDTAIATTDALAAVVEAVRGEVPVLVDGGITRGTDVAVALILGASAVLVGRPVIWGLSTYGAAGVRHVVDVLRTETEKAMALLGAPTVSDLTSDLIAAN